MTGLEAQGSSFALKLVGNIIGGNAQAAEAYRQYAQQMQQQTLSWQRNEADNKAIAEANLTNAIRTGYRVGILNMQRAQAKKKAVQDGYDLSATRQQAMGSVTANAAAAGTIGSSVQAVASDIENKVGLAVNNTADNLDTTMDNFDTGLNDVVWGGLDAQRSAVHLDQVAPNMPGGFSWGSAIFGAAADVGTSYLSSNMKLGLGKPAGS